MSLLTHAIIGVSIVSCSGEETGSENHNDEHAVHWGYEAKNGPDVWSSMKSEWAVCATGREQSPIDLRNATEIELPAVDIHMAGEQAAEVLNQTGVIHELDNGHTIQVNASTSEKLTVGDKSYALLQFHFHAPSEHTIDGKHFPMEMHFVHQADDGALAVVGVLVDEGVDHIVPETESGFYHYDGSLTTPPSSEGVKWYVRKTPTQLSNDQIAAFTAVYDHNNRPVQALGNRALYLDENPTATLN